MANRPLTASLLSIVIAMGVCLPAPALAKRYAARRLHLSKDRASAQEYRWSTFRQGASKETTYLKFLTRGVRLSHHRCEGRIRALRLHLGAPPAATTTSRCRS